MKVLLARPLAPDVVLRPIAYKAYQGRDWFPISERTGLSRQRIGAHRCPFVFSALPAAFMSEIISQMLRWISRLGLIFFIVHYVQCPETMYSLGLKSNYKRVRPLAYCTLLGHRP